MWKLSYTYKDFVGIKPIETIEKIFKTEDSLHTYIKSHPTIEVISYKQIPIFFEKNS